MPYVLTDSRGFARESPIDGPCGTILLEDAKVFETAGEAMKWAKKNRFRTDPFDGTDSRDLVWNVLNLDVAKKKAEEARSKPRPDDRLTLDHVLASLKLRSWSVPQPEGQEVAQAYKDGKLPDEATQLHVIAVLLAEARRLGPPSEKFLNKVGD